MASNEHKGLIARCLDGKARTEDYSRGGRPENRFGLFWSLFKSKFGKLVLANLTMVLTLIPLVLVVYFRNTMVGAQGMSAIFGSGLGVGYPVVPDITGQAELLVYRIDLFFYAMMIPASAIAALGIAGGGYLIRNLIWTQGVFAMKDFLRGIKRSFWCVLEALLIFSTVLFLARLAGNYADYEITMGNQVSAFIALKVFAYLFVALIIPVCLWMISLGIGYKHGPFSLFRNAVVMAVGTFPQTILFAALATWPFFLAVFVTGFFQIIGLFLLTFFGVSYCLLVWLDYTQWGFDKFVDSDAGVAAGAVPNVAANNGKQKAIAKKKSKQEPKRVVVVHRRSKLLSRPVQPMDEAAPVYELPQVFSREDLAKLSESKANISGGAIEYEKEHRGDARYVEYNKQFDERERAFEQSGDKKKKKAAKRPKMLNQRK